MVDQAKKAAFSIPIPGMSADALLSDVQRESLLLRMRAIARHELQGIEPEEIAINLVNVDSQLWSLDVVLFLMGRLGSQKEKEEMRDMYEKARDEVASSKVIDVDSQIKENIAFAMKVMRDLMRSDDERVRLAASQSMLKYAGIDVNNVEKKILEIRVSDIHETALMKLAEWNDIKPSSRLAELMESDGSN